MSDHMTDELLRWAEKQSETISVEITRQDAYNIRVALARASRSSRKPMNKDIFDRLAIKWHQAVDWNTD